MAQLYAASNHLPFQGSRGQYFANVNLLRAGLLTRTEAVNFDWGTGTPGTGIPVDSSRRGGPVKSARQRAAATSFRPSRDDGVRLFVNGVQVVNNWTDHGPATDNSPAVTLCAGQRYDIVLEYYESRRRRCEAQLANAGDQQLRPVPWRSSIRMLKA